MREAGWKKVPLLRDTEKAGRVAIAGLGLGGAPIVDAASRVTNYVTGANTPLVTPQNWEFFKEQLGIGGAQAQGDIVEGQSGPVVQTAVGIKGQKPTGSETPTAEPVTTQSTQPQAAAPAGETPMPQGEPPWKRMTHGGNQMDYRITEKGQMTPEQTAQANFRDKSKGKSDALLEARGIGGKEDDTSINGIAKMILYDNTLLPAQKASALAKLRNIEAGPNATVQAAKISADASMTNIQKTIDQQVAEKKMGRDLTDPYNQYAAAAVLGEYTDEFGRKAVDMERGSKMLEYFMKASGQKELSKTEKYLLKNRDDKKTIKEYNKDFGEGAAEKVIASYLEAYMNSEKKETK